MRLYPAALFSIFALLPTAFCMGEAAGQKAEHAQIKKEIAAVITAVFAADLGPIEKHTHAEVIATVGDRDAFIAEMKAAFAQFKENGIALAAVEVGEVIDSFEGAEHMFVLVPTKITLKVGAEKQPPAPGFQLGVRKKADEVWKYIDCSALTTELVREWFPDFPEGKEIPQAE